MLTRQTANLHLHPHPPPNSQSKLASVPPGAFPTFTSISSSGSDFARTITLTPETPTQPIGRSSRNTAKGLVADRNNGFFESAVMSRAHAEVRLILEPARKVRTTVHFAVRGGFFFCSRKRIVPWSSIYTTLWSSLGQYIYEIILLNFFGSVLFLASLFWLVPPTRSKPSHQRANFVNIFLYFSTDLSCHIPLSFQFSSFKLPNSLQSLARLLLRTQSPCTAPSSTDCNCEKKKLRSFGKVQKLHSVVRLQEVKKFSHQRHFAARLCGKIWRVFDPPLIFMNEC